MAQVEIIPESSPPMPQESAEGVVHLLVDSTTVTAGGSCTTRSGEIAGATGIVRGRVLLINISHVCHVKITTTCL